MLAEAAVARLFGEDAGESSRGSPGHDLVGWHYQRPFDRPRRSTPTGERVVAADFVSTDDGSGIVHMAPAFGEDDANVGRAEGLPVLNPVDADGTFDHTVPRGSPGCS